MRYTLLSSLLMVLFVAACTNQTNNEDDVIDTPMIENSMLIDPSDSFLPGQNTPHISYMKVKSSTIVNLKDNAVFQLSADLITKKINGKEYTMYGYNGQIPGPTIIVQKDTTITVDFKNNIDWNTTIHWHGLRHDIKNDGVPGITQEPVQPGETYTYTVYFPDEGLYWYHPHIREDIQQDNGLAGNMLVLPIVSTYYNQVNREEMLFLDDILIQNGIIVPYGKTYATHIIMGRFGNTMLVNGETDFQLSVNRGDTIRFYVTNVANVRPFNLSFGDAKIKLIGSDIGKYEEEKFVYSIIIAPAERYIIEVFFETEGVYFIKNNNPKKSYTLGSIEVSSEKTERDLSSTFNTLRKNTELTSEINSFKQYFNNPIDYEFNLTIDMPMELMMKMNDVMDNAPCHQMPDGTTMGNCNNEEEKQEEIEWEDDMGKMNAISTSKDVTWIIKDINTKKENMDIQLNTNVGDKVKIRFINDPDSMHPMQHPIHLHGQRFLVLSIDNKLQENLAWKDTVLIPTGKTIDILVDVTNPGKWMMHCHIAEHLESGMMVSFNVEA